MCNFTPYPKHFSLQILKFEENLFFWKKKTKELRILKDFLFSIGRKWIKNSCVEHFFIAFFLTLYTPKQIYAFGEKKKVKLGQVEVHKYPRPAPGLQKFWNPKSVRSTDDVIDVIRTCIRQSQIVTKTHPFHPKVYQKLISFLIQSNLL